MRSPLGGKVTSHLENSGLRSVVSDPVVISVYNGTGHRGDEDDRSVNTWLSVHLTCSSTGSEEHSERVDVEDLKRRKGKGEKGRKRKVRTKLRIKGLSQKRVNAVRRHHFLLDNYLLEFLDWVVESLVCLKDTSGGNTNV